MGNLRRIRYGLTIVLLCLLHGLASAGSMEGVGRPLAQTGGSVIQMFVQVAAKGNVNISNPGTAVFDGITLPSPASPDPVTNEHFRRILLSQQTIASENGPYFFNGASMAMTRVLDMDQRAEFRPGTAITVVQGQTYAGHEFFFSNTDLPTVGTTALMFLKRATSEPVAAAQLLTATSQINCGPNTAVVRIVTISSASAGTGVTLTSDPQILAGSDGQRCLVRGSDVDETVTVINDNGVDLLPGTASIVFNDQRMCEFIFTAETNIWRLLSCNTGSAGASNDGINDVFLRGNVIDEATVAFPFTIKDPGSAAKIVLYWAGGIPGFEFLGADGQPQNRTRRINSDKYDAVEVGGVECTRITGTGVQSFSNVCKPWRSVWFDAASISVDGVNCAQPTEQSLNSSPPTWAFSCADSTSSVFTGKTSMLQTGYDGGPVRFTLYLYHATTETISFAGDFSAQCLGDSDPLNNTFGTGVAADVSITTAHDTERQTTADVTPSGSCAVGDMIRWKYTVDATNFSTNSQNAKVLGVSMHYRAKSLNGIDE